MTLHVGFTGTQQGMSAHQFVALQSLLLKHSDAVLHHGDCIGADEQSHTIALVQGWKIHVHPPVNTRLQARCDRYDWIDEPLPYLDRNHVIVRKSTWVIAAPFQDDEQLRSGTWATIRYAIKYRGNYTVPRITQLLRNGGTREL